MGNDIKDEMVKGRPKVDRDSNSKVAFDDITIYNFPIDIGDNPACREGCPIRLGDKLIWKSKVDLNSYEDERDTRFTGKQLYIGVSDRASM